MTESGMVIEGSKMVQIILFVAYHKHKTCAAINKLTQWCWIVLGRDERDFLYDTIARCFFFQIRTHTSHDKNILIFSQVILWLILTSGNLWPSEEFSLSRTATDHSVVVRERLNSMAAGSLHLPNMSAYWHQHGNDASVRGDTIIGEGRALSINLA